MSWYINNYIEFCLSINTGSDRNVNNIEELKLTSDDTKKPHK